MKSAFYGNPVATSAAVASTTPAERAVLPAPAWPNQLVHRPVRFPSSRKFLWDRTPLGRVEVIELKDYLPVLSVPSDLHQRLLPCTSTLAVVACPSGRQLHVTVPGSSATPNPMVESITVALGASGQELVRGLAQTLQHSLDRRGSAQLTTGLALALSLKAAGAAAEGGVMGSSHVGCGSATLSATLLVPAAALTLTPLYSKRLCDVPLAQSLSQSKLPTSKVQTGYLTMDQARSLLPLAADDANVYSMPLVGVWVHGAKGLEHPTVYAAALKYAYTSCLPDLITQPDGAFLLLLFTGDSPVARCYEARFVDPPAALPGDRRLSPATPSSAASAANAGTTGVDSHGKNAGLRLLPYHVRAELAGQTSASLELNPVLDAVTAVALGPMLTLSPPNSSVSRQPPQRGALPGPAPSTAPTPYAQTHGHGCASRPGAEAGVGTAYGNYDGISQLRGSGSKLMTSPSKAMKIFAQGVGASGTSSSSTGARYGAATVMDSAYGLAAGGQLQAAGRIEPGVMDTVVVGSDNQRDSPPVPRSAAVPTPFRMIPGHGGGTDGSNSEGRGGNTPPKDPRLQHRNGAGYTAAEKTTSLFDANTSVSRTDSSITDSLHARQRLAQSRNSQSGGCRTSGDWREHISGVMSTPSAALGPRPQRVVPDWEVAQLPTQPLSQQQQHYHGASVLQPWQVPIGAPDAQQPGLQQRFAADRTSLTSAANYSGNAPPRGALGSAAAAELGASPAETPRLQADQLRHQSLTEVPSWQTGGHARAMHFHSQLNHERPSTAVAPCREGRTAGRPSTAGAGADSTRLPPFANQSLDAWLKQASGYPTVAEHGDTLRNPSIVAASDQFKKPGPETVPLNHRTTDCTEPTGRVTLQSGSDVVNEDVAMAALLNSRQGQWTSAAQYRHGPGEDMGNRGHGGQATCKRTSDEIPLQPQDRQEHGQDQSAESKRAHHRYGQQQINMYSHYQRRQQQEQAAAEYDDDLPSDPVLLRQEVLFLRRQVASLQEQLRRMAATQNPGPEGRDHRLGLASSSQHPGAAVSPGCLTSASACPSAPQVHSVEVHNNGEWRLGRSAAGDSRNGQVGQKGLRSVHEETLRQQQHEYNNTHESQQSPGGSRSRPDSRGLAEEAGHGIIDSRQGATQSGIVMQHDDLFSGSAAATDPNDQLRRDGNAVQDGMACVRSGSITAVSLAAAGTASDRVGLASMSTASDRGSVWSMASLRSSIMSYKSYRSAGTVHSSACTSDAGTAPTAALQDGAEPGPRSVGMPQQSMPVTEPTVLRGIANNGTCIESMASDATRLGPLQVVNVAGVDKAVGHGFPGIGCATVNAPALVSTCSVAFPPRLKHIRAGSINGLDIVSDSGGGRRRRRVRRASSDSESDLSVTSEPDDVAGGHSPRGIAHRTHADRQATEGGRGTPPNAPGARSHEAMAVGPVVRTKYIPLDEESESSDAESELLLMQKYGIRA